MPSPSALTLALFLHAVPEPAPNPYLAEARVFYIALEYERCLQRLEQARSWVSAQRERVELELYFGLCSYGVGDDAQGLHHFRLALALEPSATLPPGVSPKIAHVFQEEAARARPGPRVTVERPPRPPASGRSTRSVVVSAVLLGLGAASGGTGIYFGVQAKALESSANGAGYFSDADRQARAAHLDAVLANVFFGLAAAAALAAVLVFLSPGAAP